MNLRGMFTVCAAIAALSLAGCGGDAQSAPAEVEPAAAVTASAEPGPYAEPGAMLKKVRAVGVKLDNCDGEAIYNIYGALSIGCWGARDATVYLETFPDQAIGEAIKAAQGLPGGQYHVGQGWLVGTQDPALFAQLVAALA